MKRRGIENVLLRRVRRHESMTALFRASSSERPSQLQTRPVDQEQDSPVSPQIAAAGPSISVTPPRSNTVARQAMPSSTSIPKPLASPSSTPAESGPAKTPDLIWNRLQTIFRKHQEQGNPPEEDVTDLKADTTESIQAQAHEEKGPLQRTSTEEHILPPRPQEMAIPAIRSVQRSLENAELKSGPVSTDVQYKVQTPSSTSPKLKKPETARDIEFKPALPDQKVEADDQASIANEPKDPSLPLESVWNVQRVEAPHPLFHESSPRPTFGSTDENETPVKTSQASDQKPGPGPVQLHREDDKPTERKIPDSPPISEQGGESHAPVEILSPSRPRPLQANLPVSSPSIQRQSRDHHAPKDVNAVPPVNTAIGPLPADLWWLLGQKPPSDSPASQPDIQRAIHPDQKQAPFDQSNSANSSQTPVTPAEPLAEPTPMMPGTIQRQVLSKDALPATPEEPITPPRTEETSHAELPDLDDLARRVYAEVRRRLAAEWERRR